MSQRPLSPLALIPEGDRYIILRGDSFASTALVPVASARNEQKARERASRMPRGYCIEIAELREQPTGYGWALVARYHDGRLMAAFRQRSATA